MQDGAGVIVQAALQDGRWGGRADLPIRTDEFDSDLGSHSYEVADTKLARNARGEMMLQLALYSGLVRKIQNRAPRRFHVVKPGRSSGGPFDVESFRVQDYDAYYRLVRRRLEERVDGPPDDSTYPHPVSHCEICASSSAGEAPRGMSFLYDPHRFNVATSRARCTCIVVGSPALLEPECRSPEQMRWANVLCRYEELSE